jgi:hypothetical protein
MELILVKATNQTQCWGGLDALKRNIQEKELRKEFEEAQLMLQQNQDDMTSQGIFQEQMQALKALEENRSRWKAEQS